jgi:xanthine dehydrogenase YagR molybdenum-binding subunit
MSSRGSGAAPAWGPRDQHKVLHRDTPRLSAAEKVEGKADYSMDRRPEGMLFGRLVCVPVAAAEVKVDVAPALALEGVEAAVVLREGRTMYNGQAVAAVAARTPELAADGARAVALDVTELGWVVTPEAARKEDSPRVDPKRPNRAPRGRRGGTHGDEEETLAALEGAAFTVDAEYYVPVQHHACLEPHGVVADYNGGDEATIYASSQVVFGIPGSAARELELSRQDVRAVTEHMGGGFGSKFSMDVAGRAACMLAKQAGKPVHLFNDRTQEFQTGGNRSGSIQRIRAGVTAEGEICALHTVMDKLGGLGRGPGARQPYIYEAGETFTAEFSLHTNTDSSRAMRAPGHPQVSFAIESTLDQLAYGIGEDLVEFRKKNLSDPVYHRQLERVAREIGWHEHPHRNAPGRGDGWTAEGIGFGVATWGGGGGRGAGAEVRIERDGGVSSSIGVQDLGTGVRTLVAMIPAEELGLSVEQVRPRIGDTFLPMGVGSGGSVTTASIAPVVKSAAWNARLAFAEHLAPVLECEASDVRFEGGKAFASERPGRGLDWKDACGTLPAEGLAAQGEWVGSLQASGVHGAQAARVRVDLMTGGVDVLKMVAIQDSGLVLNPLTWRSQVNGAMIQSMGQALFEERVMDPDLGIALNSNFGDYKIPGSLEIPELVALIDEEDTREAVIGVGEPPVIPGVGAIAGAVHNACGARVTSLPLTPDKVLEALAKLS